jgi:hypothetical protein
MRLPYGLGAYRREHARLPEVVLRNLFVERTPANLKEGVVLLARPVLSASYELGDGPIRGLYRQDGVLGGDVFAVSGTTLYRGETDIGEINGDTLVEMAGLSAKLYIAAGGLYSTDGVTVTAESFPDSAPVRSVAVIDGIVVAVRSDTGRMYFLLPGTSDWGALDFFSAESEPDPVLCVRKVGDELWAFGSSTVTPFASTGSSETPFEPYEGRTYSRGIRARQAVALLDNTAFWVGEDAQVYRGAEVPEVISTDSIAERIAKSAADELRMWSYPWRGHTFAVLSCGSQGTWVYDVATREWAEAQTSGLSYWRAHLGVTNGSEIICGDALTGQIWTLSDDTAVDGGEAFERTFTAGMVPGDTAIPCDVIEVECTTGHAAVSVDAVIEMKISRDGGNTWGNWRSASLGLTGKYRARALWRRNGIIDCPTVFQFRTTDAAPVSITGVRMNETLIGRARG